MGLCVAVSVTGCAQKYVLGMGIEGTEDDTADAVLFDLTYTATVMPSGSEILSLMADDVVGAFADGDLNEPLGDARLVFDVDAQSDSITVDLLDQGESYTLHSIDLEVAPTGEYTGTAEGVRDSDGAAVTATWVMARPV